VSPFGDREAKAYFLKGPLASHFFSTGFETEVVGRLSSHFFSVSFSVHFFSGVLGTPKYQDGSCCDKAAKKGEKCVHPCCVKAAKAGKVCDHCNEPAKK
jgi:hypothetical protein